MRYRASAQDEAQEGIMEREWREPPGYLGEAVRRAKLIPLRPAPLPLEP
jgi:hypothetical protein